jgi:hypothetical protein
MKLLDVNSSRKKTISWKKIAAKNLGGHVDVEISIVSTNKFREIDIGQDI